MLCLGAANKQHTSPPTNQKLPQKKELYPNHMEPLELGWFSLLFLRSWPVQRVNRQTLRRNGGVGADSGRSRFGRGTVKSRQDLGATLQGIAHLDALRTESTVRKTSDSCSRVALHACSLCGVMGRWVVGIGVVLLKDML